MHSHECNCLIFVFFFHFKGSHKIHHGWLISTDTNEIVGLKYIFNIEKYSNDNKLGNDILYTFTLTHLSFLLRTCLRNMIPVGSPGSPGPANSPANEIPANLICCRRSSSLAPNIVARPLVLSTYLILFQKHIVKIELQLRWLYYEVASAIVIDVLLSNLQFTANFLLGILCLSNLASNFWKRCIFSCFRKINLNIHYTWTSSSWSRTRCQCHGFCKICEKFIHLAQLQLYFNFFYIFYYVSFELFIWIP